MSDPQPVYRVAAEHVRVVRTRQQMMGVPAGLAHAWELSARSTVCGRPLVSATRSPLHTFADVWWADSALDACCPHCFQRGLRAVW